MPPSKFPITWVFSFASGLEDGISFQGDGGLKANAGLSKIAFKVERKSERFPLSDRFPTLKILVYKQPKIGFA
jgi:hypothetical protein